jgi:hypothetical protein
MFKKCIHEWEAKDREVLESAFEQAKNHGVLFEEFKGSFQVFQKTFISILVCKKCGKIEKTVVRSIE